MRTVDGHEPFTQLDDLGAREEDVSRTEGEEDRQRFERLAFPSLDDKRRKNHDEISPVQDERRIRATRLRKRKEVKVDDSPGTTALLNELIGQKE